MNLLPLCLFSLVAISSSIVVPKSSKSAVFIAGDLSGIGSQITNALTNNGITVRALLTKDTSTNPFKGNPLVTTLNGDASDEEAVQNCMNGCIAAVTLVSGKTDDDGSAKLDYSGNSNIVEQAGILGVERIVFVSSLGCGETKSSVTEAYLQSNADIIQARNRAEKDLRMYTNLEWTIIRSGLIDTSTGPTGKAVLTADTTVGGCISSQDLAVLVVKALTTPGGKLTRREVTALDPTLTTTISSAPISTQLEVLLNSLPE